MSSTSTLLSLIGLLGSAVNVVCQIGLLVVVQGAVRRHRPDAYRPLLGWAIGALVAALASPVLSTVVNVIVGRMSGMDGLIAGQGALTLVFAVIHITLAVILARGLVRIAQPPKPVVLDSGAAYR